ncbi:MAG: nucleoid-associated protein [Clostridiales bacterium]|jgi:hypothetical protein|nr:nucleoid-associated protein [Clostridiales bacterium]
MEFTIENAILHVLNNGEVRYSEEELDLDSDTVYSFVTKQIKKILSDSNGKESIFNESSQSLAAVSAYIGGEINFREFSVKICEKMSELIKEGFAGASDMLVAKFSQKSRKHIALIKLKYKHRMTHNDSNQIVNIPSIESGSFDDACVIGFDPVKLIVLEKPSEKDGSFYFSEVFLDCATEMSRKQAADIITAAFTEVNSKYFSDSPETEAKLKAALVENAIDDEGYVSAQNAAAAAFSDNEEAKAEFIDAVKAEGLIKDVHLGEKFAKQQFAAVKFKADNGVELKFPCGIYDDPNVIQFEAAPDGSFTVTLKNLRRSV